jgi:hypothetical protein
MHKFSLRKPRNWKAVYAMLVEDAKHYGVKINGNEQSGSGSFKNFSGKFIIKDSDIWVTVLDKPVLIFNSLIESYVKEYIQEKERLVS